MHTAAGSARVGTRRVRALLDHDRRSANEVRPDLEEVRLVTAEYRVPLRVRLKRSYREDERVRLGGLVLSVGVVLLLLASVGSALATALASHGQESAAPLAPPERLDMRAPTPAVSHQPRARPTPELAQPEQPVLRDRLQHARRVLRVAGAARARTLLEDLVRDKPRNGRAYATLAEACLRLSDAHCARDAVTKAVARQPRRAKYRALAGRIERAFAASSER